MELKRADGSWTAVAEPDHPVDLAAEEAGLSFFNNQGRVPEGGYVNFRVTLSDRVRVAGRDGDFYTAAGGEAEIGTVAGPSGAPPKISSFREKVPTLSRRGPPGDVTLRLVPGGGSLVLSGREDFGTPLRVAQGSFIGVWFTLDLKGTLRRASPGEFGPGSPERDAMVFLPWRRVQGATVTIDGATRTLDADAVTLVYGGAP